MTPIFDYYEAEHISGLQPLVETELRELSRHMRLLPGVRDDGVPFVPLSRKRNRPAPNLLTDNRLRQLRLPTAVYGVLFYEIPRPKSLLGHEHWHRLLAVITAVRTAFPKHTFQTFRLSAAGQDTAVFQRIKMTLAQDTGLQLDEDDAHLFLRVRRTAKGQKRGWEVLVRLTPLPLATRPWRVVNYPGALNGPLCAAMHHLVQAQATDRVLNFMCGSGSLLADWPAPGATLMGLDISPEALAAAGQNTAHVQPAPLLLRADAQHLPLPSASFDCLLADVPWGQLVGDVAEHDALYPAVLAEAGRVASPGARLALITQDVQRLENCLKQQAAWQVTKRLKIRQGRVRPTIFLCMRR